MRFIFYHIIAESTFWPIRRPSSGQTIHRISPNHRQQNVETANDIVRQMQCTLEQRSQHNDVASNLPGEAQSESSDRRNRFGDEENENQQSGNRILDDILEHDQAAPHSDLASRSPQRVHSPPQITRQLRDGVDDIIQLDVGWRRRWSWCLAAISIVDDAQFQVDLVRFETDCFHFEQIFAERETIGKLRGKRPAPVGN